MLYLSPAVTAYLLFVCALLGLVMGSFCNAWAWRLAHGEHIAKGRSHCAVCGHTLAAFDLIPLLSYLLLKGRCRYCGAPISRRYPAVEAVSAAFFVSVLLRWDVSWPALRFLALGCLLLTLSLVDWETREIPDGLLAAAALLSLLRLPAEGLPGLKSALLGAVAISVPLLLFVLLADRVMGRETMGGGDIKLFAVLGLHLGPGQTLLLLILSCLAGLLLALLGGRRNPSPPAETEETERPPCEGGCPRSGLGGQIPFGPAVSLAAWPVVLFGAQALRWYMGLFAW